jgi:hypothetical protein
MRKIFCDHCEAELESEREIYGVSRFDGKTRKEVCFNCYGIIGEQVSAIVIQELKKVGTVPEDIGLFETEEWGWTSTDNRVRSGLNDRELYEVHPLLREWPNATEDALNWYGFAVTLLLPWGDEEFRYFADKRMMSRA